MIGIIVIVAVIFCGKVNRSNFGGVSPDPDDVCSGHCFKNSQGQIMDVYDCCECKATVSGSYEPNFHKCMCEAGYGDYCYLPVTNLLLSQ